MTRTSIHEYVAAQRPRYLAASRREKRRILDEVVAVTGYHRKATLRRLHRAPRFQPVQKLIGRVRVEGRVRRVLRTRTIRVRAGHGHDRNAWKAWRAWRESHPRPTA